MTINLSDNSPRISYSVGAGVVQSTFTVPFEFFAEESLNVYVDSVLKTLTTDYTTTGGNGATGSVLISVTGASGGSTVVITREIPLERTTDFPTSGPFQISALNTELDRIVAIAADVQDKSIRSIRAADSDATASYTLPLLDARKGTVLGFNATSGNVEVGPKIADVQSLSSVSADIALLADIEDGTTATNAITNVNGVRTDIATLGPIASNITTVSGVSSNVTTVAGISGNVTTVSGISSDVTTLAGISSDVTTAANNDANITTVSGISGNVTTVAGISGNVTSVAGISSNVTSVAAIDSDVTTVAGISSNVSTVAGISSDIATVAADGTDIGTVAGISSNITTVAGDSADIQSLGALSSEIGLLGVASVITDMSALGASSVVNDMNALGASANITAMGLLGTSAVVTDMSILGTADVVNDMNVLGTTANVTAMNVLGTSGNVTAMSTVSGNIADVTAVAADATDIGTVATDLSGSDNIGTVAGSISNVNNVGGSIASVNTVASNLASVNNFGETYRIAASDPTTSLDEGDLYFDTTNNVMKVYDGSAWVAAYASLSGALAVANNLSDLSNASAALTNLGIPGVEANADVTDTANVTAAGALMDSEVTNLAQVKAFDSSDYSPAAGSSSIVTTGALNSGSITSGFGAIDVGSSAISTTGVITAGEVTMTTLDIGGTNVTASAAELNYNDITTLGTSQASKVVTSDANNVVTFSGGIVEDSVTITSSSGAATLNMQLGTNFIHDLTEDVTYTFSNAASSGNVSSFSLKIIQGSTARLITWPTSVDWVAATAPTLTTDDNAVDIFVFQTMDGGTTWYGFVAGQALG
tara:strand:- start:1884 stop:4358 length:2475 start_codon:yes stop_codon:yes gene_type:complete